MGTNSKLCPWARASRKMSVVPACPENSSIWAHIADGQNGFDAIQLWHDYVRDHNIGTSFSRILDCIAPAVTCDGVPAIPIQNLRQAVGDGTLIVNYEDLLGIAMGFGRIALRILHQERLERILICQA